MMVLMIIDTAVLDKKMISRISLEYHQLTSHIQQITCLFLCFVSLLNLISWKSYLVRFGLPSPEYFCDNPHIVRRLPRDQNHDKKVWIESLGRRRDGMVYIPREMSYYVWVIAEILGRCQTKPNQITDLWDEIWFSLINVSRVFLR